MSKQGDNAPKNGPNLMYDGFLEAYGQAHWVLTTSIVYYNLIGLFHYYGFSEAWNISLFTYKVNYIKAIGGSNTFLGAQNDVGLILKYFSLAFQRFLQNVNIFFLAQYIRVKRRPGMAEIAHFPI